MSKMRDPPETSRANKVFHLAKILIQFACQTNFLQIEFLWKRQAHPTQIRYET